MDAIEVTALKPCPFCGCEMKLLVSTERTNEFGPRKFYSPVAVKSHEGLGGHCSGQDVRGSASVEAATTRWNTRTPSSAGLVEALEPIRHWYESDEHPPRDDLDIARDAVADLQADRAQVFRHIDALKVARKHFHDDAENEAMKLMDGSIPEHMRAAARGRVDRNMKAIHQIDAALAAHKATPNAG